MEGNNSPLYIIENQSEKNVDQILDINNENFESMQNINMIEPVNTLTKEAKMHNNKGFVRIFRNIFKKKDKNRKKILGNRFVKWRKESLKGLKIKKTIVVRISVSREKDLKHKNKFNIEKEKEKEKSKSVNKNQIKSFNKNVNNLKTEIIKNNIDNKIETKIYDNKFNNIGIYEVAKKIKNYKGKNDNQAINKNKDLINNNINNTKNINNDKIKTQNKKIEINDNMPKITPKIDKNRNIYPIYNPSAQNNAGFGPTPQKQYDNVSVVFTSSTKKAKNDIPINKNNNLKSAYNLNNNNQHKNIQSSDKNNQSKGYYMKYEGYHKDKKENPIMTPKLNQNNTNRQSYKYNKNEYNLSMNIKRKISDNIDNSFSQLNKTDYNKYMRKTYQTNARTGNNKEKNTIDTYDKKDKNYTYSQNTAKPSLKSGVTTVVQHYSGRRKQ